MNVLTRYSITGYILFFIVALYSPEIYDTFKSNYDNKSLVFILIAAIFGIPMGYLINQLSSFLFHTIPAFGMRGKCLQGRLITSEAKFEMDVYRDQLNKFGKDFGFREWYVWRWTHLTINMNLMISIVFAFILSLIVNGISSGSWYPIYCLPIGSVVCPIIISLFFLVLLYNSYILRWFIAGMHKEIQRLKGIQCQESQ